MQSVLLGNHGAISFFGYILFIILAGTVTVELRAAAFSDYHYGGERAACSGMYSRLLIWSPSDEHRI